MGIVLFVVVRIIGVFDHENVKLEIVTGDGERLHVEIVIGKLHIAIGFGVINFEYFLVCLWYGFE